MFNFSIASLWCTKKFSHCLPNTFEPSHHLARPLVRVYFTLLEPDARKGLELAVWFGFTCSRIWNWFKIECWNRNCKLRLRDNTFYWAQVSPPWLTSRSVFQMISAIGAKTFDPLAKSTTYSRHVVAFEYNLTWLASLAYLNQHKICSNFYSDVFALVVI